MPELTNTSLRLLEAIRRGRVNRVGNRDYLRRNAGPNTVKSAVTMTPVLGYAALGEDCLWHLTPAGDAALDEWLAIKAERAPVVSSG